MRTTDFSQILFEALQYSGNDRHNINDETFGQFRDFANARLREAWEQDEWPDLCRLAQFTTSIDTNNVVSFTLPSDAGEVLGVFNKNPQSSTRVTDLGYDLYNDGTTTKVIVQNRILADGWYHYRIKCPALVGDLYNPSVVYYQGSQVYFDSGSGTGTYLPVSGKPHSGNFYTCVVNSTVAGNSPTTHPASWQKVNIPYIFAHYLSWGSAANWFASENLVQEAGAIEAKANERLAVEVDKIARQQNQTSKIRFINPYS
jgi:hypothetical protein